MPAGSDLMSVDNGPRPPVPCWPGRPVEMVAPYRVSENIPKKSLKNCLRLLRIAEAQPRRWAAWRAVKAGDGAL